MSVTKIYRAAALAHADVRRREENVLRLSPAWTRWAYWVVVAALGAAAAFGLLATVYEYAGGPAVVWASGREDVTSAVAGTIASVEVQPGQHVDAGQVLVRLHAGRERAELEGAEREFEAELVKTLRDPADGAARQALAALRAKRDLAAARLAELSLRAPRAGVVGDLRLRPGQPLAAGDAALTLTFDDARCAVVAVLPGQHRPHLRPGLPLRFEVAGYRRAHRDLAIDAVEGQVVGPAEVRRALGQSVADTIKVEGPVNLVRAALPSCDFEADGERLPLYHGMGGRAEARVRPERAVFAFAPALRAVFGGGP
ncbi:MAG TPA: HlyD family efflux transporter periplasmic adaptor subunit [Polyangiaceae bacterium]|nr:HlyD family efflux transporter periplasmic adaptor subunit [Polyangiaceae bacterium]